MKDLSLHVLDIAQNSISAGAAQLEISLTEGDTLLTLSLADDGRGMSPEFLAAVTDPFTTTRTTRKVGLGLPLLRMAAEQTGGSLTIESAVGVGTTVTAVFAAHHIDTPPVGDMAGTVALILQGAPELELVYTRNGTAFDTRAIRAVLGPDISLSAPEVVLWMQ
ncbi:MAG: ATP-binding protein, partial [Pseudoflavonifractor sp.]